ncbi:MAG: 16S rRNA (adenine(1518)-N(6)/adenine(1519)-N(6))-dimethyltransferase RsmA [Planctomycetota bacterium]
MQTLTEIKALLERAGHGPKKALGQNFLIDRNLVTKLIESSGAAEGDLVLEVGPGTGTLTQSLLGRGVRVIACELDSALSVVLRETLGERYPDSFTLVEGDCLDGKHAINADVVRLIDGRPFRLVANLPYHAATPLMINLMTRHPNCTGMSVTIQTEVVDRFAGTPGTKAFGAISVIAQWLGQVERIARLPPECFWPRPDVTSAMMGWSRRSDLSADPRWWIEAGEVVQTLFQSRRKQLGKPVRRLAGGEVDWPAGIGVSDRVESLPVDRIVDLASAILSARGRS